MIKIDRDIGKLPNLGCHLVSFRYGDHILGFQIKGRETIALVFAQPHFFFSRLTKLRDKINVFSKMTHFWADFLPDFGVPFSRSPTTYLILVKEKKIKMRNVIPSALAIMAAVDFFSVRSISKVINRKQSGHVVLHGL